MTHALARSTPCQCAAACGSFRANVHKCAEPPILHYSPGSIDDGISIRDAAKAHMGQHGHGHGHGLGHGMVAVAVAVQRPSGTFDTLVRGYSSASVRSRRTLHASPGSHAGLGGCVLSAVRPRSMMGVSLAVPGALLPPLFPGIPMFQGLSFCRCWTLTLTLHPGGGKAGKAGLGLGLGLRPWERPDPKEHCMRCVARNESHTGWVGLDWTWTVRDWIGLALRPRRRLHAPS